jgi:type I restriction enzyme S subunit
VRLGEVAKVLNGFAFKSTHFNANDIGTPLIRIRDVGADRTGTWYSGDEFDDRYVVEYGDLLVGMDGDFRSSRWRGGQALLNQRVCKITVKRPDLLSGRFLEYLLPGYLEEINRYTSSITVKHLSSTTILELPLPLPTIAEQHQIVAAIEKHFSRLDAAVASLRRVSQRVVHLRAGIMRLVDAAPTVPLASFLTEPLANGRSVRTAEGRDGFPVLRLTALRAGGRLDLAERKMGAWTRAEATRFLVRTGDFLISRGNGSLSLVGRGGLVDVAPEEVAYPDTMIRARINGEKIRGDFLRLAWDGQVVRQQIQHVARTTAGIYKVNQQDLAQVRVPTPSLEEQGHIVAEVERGLTLVSSLATAVGRALLRSAHLRQAILALAFSGQLVAQDPQDEPTKELPARITKERFTTPLQHGRNA